MAGNPLVSYMKGSFGGYVAGQNANFSGGGLSDFMIVGKKNKEKKGVFTSWL